MFKEADNVYRSYANGISISYSMHEIVIDFSSAEPSANEHGYIADDTGAYFSFHRLVHSRITLNHSTAKLLAEQIMKIDMQLGVTAKENAEK